MFSFLRTSRSVRKSRLSSNPGLIFYKVKLVPGKAQRYGLPLLGLTTTGVFLFNNSQDGSLNRLISDKPLHVPIWFVQKVNPEPYKTSGPEYKEYKEFLQDKHRRVKAETAVLNAVRRSIQNSNVDIGHFEGFAAPFWMTFSLTVPPPQFSRKYLAISLTNIEIVSRPVHPVNVARLAASLYPQALASSFYSFGLSLYNSVFSVFRTDDQLGKYKPPALQRPPASRLPKPDSDKNKDPEIPLLPSNVVIAFNDAFSDGMTTLEREWHRDRSKNRPHPPRGWLIADGTIRLVGSELAIVVDFQVAINPKNFDQGFVYNLKARHHARRRGLMIKTFQKPSLPGDPPAPQIQQQQQQQSQQQPQQPAAERKR
ncbi:hypothetical protein ABW19_dt0209091 [Dactylella cylindrospora]|nr:hypothetical protein ABW19_dt0209091 [Dactylella cylindrospora]